MCHDAGVWLGRWFVVDPLSSPGLDSGSVFRVPESAIPAGVLSDRDTVCSRGFAEMAAGPAQPIKKVSIGPAGGSSASKKSLRFAWRVRAWRHYALARVSRQALSSRASISCPIADSSTITSPVPTSSVLSPTRNATKPDRTCRVRGPAV